MEMVLIPSSVEGLYAKFLCRLVLSEGIFTVLLGIFTFFYLPDCMSPCQI